MAKSKATTSQRFSRAARAERDRLDRKRAQLHQRREVLQAKIDALDEEIETVADQLQVLEGLAESGRDAVEIREVDRSHGGLELLSGSTIRVVAVPLLIRTHGCGPIHYRDWYALLNQRGYAAAGKRPDAVFLNQVARSPLVRPTTRSGYYMLDLEVVDQLREQLRKQQTALAELLTNVPAASESLETHRQQLRELHTAISRTERDLSEAVNAMEAAGEGAEVPMAEAA